MRITPEQYAQIIARQRAREQLGHVKLEAPPPPVKIERPKPKTKRHPSYNTKVIEAYFAEQGLPKPIFEFQFAPPRRWRFDIAFLGQKVAIEVQGGLFTGGGHVRGAFLLLEYSKLSNAAAEGWLIIYRTPDNLCMLETVELVKRAIESRTK